MGWGLGPAGQVWVGWPCRPLLQLLCTLQPVCCRRGGVYSQWTGGRAELAVHSRQAEVVTNWYRPSEIPSARPEVTAKGRRSKPEHQQHLLDSSDFSHKTVRPWSRDLAIVSRRASIYVERYLCYNFYSTLLSALSGISRRRPKIKISKYTRLRNKCSNIQGTNGFERGGKLSLKWPKPV